MLKKAGIVAAATAACLLSVTPLAFAGEYHDKDDHKGHSKDHRDNDVNVQRGLINISDIGIQLPVQACGNDLLSGVLGILSSGLKNGSGDDVNCKQNNASD